MNIVIDETNIARDYDKEVRFKKSTNEGDV